VVALRISYRRRDVVEGVNAALKGAFVNIGQKFFKVFGLTKIKILLAFTLAAYNLETIRSFLSRMAVVAEAARKPRSRKKRREVTWRDVVSIRPETGPDPRPADPPPHESPALDQGRHRHVAVTPFARFRASSTCDRRRQRLQPTRDRAK